MLQRNHEKTEIPFLCYVFYIFSCHTKNKQEKIYFSMANITQAMRYVLSFIQYTKKFGITKAALKYKTNRQYIYP